MGKKQIQKNQKTKKNIGKIASKIMIIILIAMMLLSVGATIIYYLVF